jgi:hypothetical protein
MSGKPTVATVPPRCAERLAAMGNDANRPSAFNKARSLAASTFTASQQNNPIGWGCTVLSVIYCEYTCLNWHFVDLA